MSYFNIVAETNENTVVTEYTPVTKRSDAYQSEAALEAEFIRLLTEQGYEYLPIHSEEDLVLNLRRQLEKLCARAGSHGLALSVEPGAAEELARQALSSSGGAREIRHLLQTCVQTPLADALLSGAAAGNRVVAAREGKLVVTVTGDDRTETGK